VPTLRGSAVVPSEVHTSAVVEEIIEVAPRLPTGIVCGEDGEDAACDTTRVYVYFGASQESSRHSQQANTREVLNTYATCF